MSHTATISCKVSADHYALLQAMATAQHTTLSELVRDTLVRALDLDLQRDRLIALFADRQPEPN